MGFRPFVYRLATESGLHGWVKNSPQGVFLEVEGPRASLETFLLRLETAKPPRSFIQSLEAVWLDPAGYRDFAIHESDLGGEKTALVLPDIATCADCRREIFDPANRRYFYPFTNCTHCGPRFSIIEALPYDRANTSMRCFAMCPLCQAEYEDPSDRRFHAQPNACPACGPVLELRGQGGSPTPGNPTNEGVLRAAVEALGAGAILAVKGLGGFHLMVAAHDDEAVQRLRHRKHREEKPFALMFPSTDAIREACEVSPLEDRLLRSPEAPIVLLRRHATSRSRRSPAAGLAPGLAPHNPNLGVMLPYTPLHHLLLALMGRPLVATSGNLSDEPICISENEAFERLGGIVDLFLIHNRPIVRQVDDSIVRLMAGRELVLRRSRGYAPLPITLPTPGSGEIHPEPPPILAVGAHLKNTVALAVGRQAFLSQHIGDLETAAAYAAFRRVITDFERLYETAPALIVADQHPDYLSTQFARETTSGTTSPRLVQVQHHVAHILACMAENELAPPALGVSWDGTGYGPDGTIWGGEFFLVTETGCDRVTHFRPFPLPGGDKAVKEPRRAALGLLFNMEGKSTFARSDCAPLQAFSPADLAVLQTMLHRKLNTPLTSSVGRLFDAAASLAGLRQSARFEGQAAMEFEFALEHGEIAGHYPIPLIDRDPPATASPETIRPPLLLDWQPMVEALLWDVRRSVSLGLIAAKFHNALAEAIVTVAGRFNQQRVVLSGGCFQNRYLTERAILRLRKAGFAPYWHQRVPPNDGGIALGQVVAARQRPG